MVDGELRPSVPREGYPNVEIRRYEKKKLPNPHGHNIHARFYKYWHCQRADLQCDERRIPHRLRHSVRIVRSGDGDAKHLQHDANGHTKGADASLDDKKVWPRRGGESRTRICCKERKAVKSANSRFSSAGRAQPRTVSS